MYDDGYSAGGDSNVDCGSPDATGCWAHRRAILSSFKGERLLFAARDGREACQRLAVWER